MIWKWYVNRTLIKCLNSWEVLRKMDSSLYHLLHVQNMGNSVGQLITTDYKILQGISLLTTPSVQFIAGTLVDFFTEI